MNRNDFGETVGRRTPATDALSGVEDLREVCEQLTELVWALGTWNDHNFTHADYARWRVAARSAAKRAESILNALTSGAPHGPEAAR
jgi:hypothetical protein